MAAEQGGGRPQEMRLLTWNIAAINNNPFEYYATLEDEPGYEKLMIEVQEFIDSPGKRDVAVSEVFTVAMWERLKVAMSQQGWAGIDQVEQAWLKDFAGRKIISGFLKDKEIGSKRLASMPDRFTNTINCSDGSLAYRPTVINNYQREMLSLGDWFDQWHEFMFSSKVAVKNKKGESETKQVCALLQPISRAKYPAISEEEAAISIPLQILALGIFDAILVHIMNVATAGDSAKWHRIKMMLCSALVVHKQLNVLKILEGATGDADVIFLQEVAGAFVEKFRQSSLSERFALLAPSGMDHVRDQNSLILVARERLAAEPAELSLALAKDVPVADGDICAFEVPLKVDAVVRRTLLASFHGDTAGLASTPVVNAVRQAAADRGLPLIFGLDANTHVRQDPKGSTKHIDDFLTDLKAGPLPLQHSWAGEPKSWCTTFNARTYLQPQLNKAVRFDERLTSKLTDCHPKDFVLCSEKDFEVAAAAVKDNTGRGEFVEGMDFPTLSFPSDHALVSTALRWRGAVAPDAAMDVTTA